MSHYGSLNTVRRTGSKNDLATGMTYLYSRSEAAHGRDHEYEPPVAGIKSSKFSRATISKGGGMMTSGSGGGTMGGMRY